MTSNDTCFQCGRSGLDLSDRSPATPCNYCMKENWELMECPINNTMKCDKLKGNKDFNNLVLHLMGDHPKADLAGFITEGVQDNWD